MAHTLTDTGLSAMLSVFPATASAQPTAMWIGLFGSQTSGTVPNRTAHGGAAPGGWVESVGVPRVRVDGNSWGAAAIVGNGVRFTAAQVIVTATAAGSANGSVLANRPSSVAADIPYGFANFDDLTTITYNSGAVIRITPTFGFNVSALA